MNGEVEAAKKPQSHNRENGRNYKHWHNKLHFSLWGSKTSMCTSIGVTPYSLVYKMEVVQPIELKIPSLCIVLESKLPKDDWV